jgi:hypothetical protein
MTRARLWGYFAGTAVVAALIGFLFGWYQAFPAQHSRDRALLRLRLSEARGRTQEARIALVRANYGNARTHVEEAIRLLDAFKSSSQRELPQTESARVDQARQLLQDALSLAPTMPTAPGTAADGSPRPEDQADAKAMQAANLLGEVYRATPEP